MAKTIEQLKAQSAEVKNASVVGENTATRVGTLFTDIVEHQEMFETQQAQKDAQQSGELESKLTAETERAVAAEQANTAAIAAEVERAKAAEQGLTDALAEETNARITGISNETVERNKAIGEVYKTLQAEADERSAADAGLQEALSAEIKRSTEFDSSANNNITELKKIINGESELDPEAQSDSPLKVLRIIDGFAGYFYNREGYKSLVYDLTAYKGRRIKITPAYTGNNTWVFYAFVRDYKNILTTASSEVNDIEAWNNNLISEQHGGAIVSEHEVPSIDGNVFIIITASNDDTSALELLDKVIEKGLYDKVEDNTKEIEALKNAEKPSTDIIEQDCYILRKEIKTVCPYYLAVDSEPTGYVRPYLDEKIANIPRGQHFIFITDTHFEHNAGHSTLLIDYVKKRLGIKCVVFGGDGLDAQDNKYKAANALSDYSDEFFDTFGKYGLWVQGNHDCNGPMLKQNDNIDDIIVSDEEVFNRTLKKNASSYVYDTDGLKKIKRLTSIESDYDRNALEYWMKMHYYYDDKENKVRYIVIETQDVGYCTEKILATSNGDSGRTTVQSLEVEFVAQALMTVKDGYDVILCGHWFKATTTSMTPIMHVFYSFKNRLVCKINCTAEIVARPVIDEYWKLDNDNKYYDKIFDFSKLSINTGKCFIISGHVHSDGAFVMQTIDGNKVYNPYKDLTSLNEDALLHITTTTDCYMRSGVEVDTEYEDGSKQWQMTQGTITEQAFDVITYTAEKVYCTRFGAGEDREFDY